VAADIRHHTRHGIDPQAQVQEWLRGVGGPACPAT
jgi:hypothetical protein